MKSCGSAFRLLRANDWLACARVCAVCAGFGAAWVLGAAAWLSRRDPVPTMPTRSAGGSLGWRGLCRHCRPGLRSRRLAARRRRLA